MKNGPMSYDSDSAKMGGDSKERKRVNCVND